MNPFRNFKKQKMNLVAFGITLLVIVVVSFVVSNYSKVHKYDSLRINLSGRQRMLSQKMAKEILLFQLGKIDKEAVLSTVKVFNATLFVLKEGGAAPLDLSMTEFELLPKMEEKQTRDQLEKIMGLWQIFEQKIESFLQNRDDLSMNYIIDNNKVLMDEIDTVVVMMQHSAEKSLTRLYLIIIAAVLISLLVFAERTRRLSKANKKLSSEIIERKKIGEALERSEDNLKRAQEVAHIGSWRLDLVKNELIWSDEAYRIFGVPKGKNLDYEMFLEMIHPEDRAYVDKAWKAAINKEPYDIEHRILVDSKVKWVKERAEIEFNEEGKAISGVGTTQDITEHKRSEKELDKYREQLEQLVAEQTTELKEKVKDLEIFHDVAIDRELKMKEQREKVVELENRLKERSHN